MKKDTTQKKKMIPSYAILPLLICIAVNFTVYIGTDKLMEHRNFYDLTLPVDRMVPVIPAFSVIYIGCYLFWIVNYIMITRMNRSHCYRFILADVMSRLVCGFFYIVMPTTNVRPVVNGTDIFSQMLRWVYQIDDPTRLFPSIHCLVSWNCYIGVRNIKEYPVSFKNMAAVIAVMVFISTLVTKQHVIADVISAVAISEVCWLVVNKTGVYRFLLNIMNGVKEASK